MDLYTLRNKFTSVSALPIIPLSELNDKPNGLMKYYCEKLDIGSKNAGWYVTDEFLFFGKIIQETTGETILVGPASEYVLSYDAKKLICDKLGYKRKKAIGFRQQLSNIPIIKLTDCIQQLSFLNYIINGDESVTTFTDNSEAPSPRSDSNSSVGFVHNTSHFEDFVISCIQFGKADSLDELFHSQEISKYSTGVTATATMRAQKNLFIVATTLASRAAIKGGLDYDVSLSISDKYINRIEETRTYNEFEKLFRKMILEFATRVAELKLPSGSTPIVNSAVRLINSRLYQKIKVEQLAEELKVNRSYLSHHFLKETGESLSDYIARRKIAEAIRLMKTTDMTLADISYRLAFSSQSHFHKTFKKVTGENPGKYPRQK